MRDMTDDAPSDREQLERWWNPPVPMRVARVYAPIAAGLTMLFGPRFLGGLRTAEAQEAPVYFGTTNVIDDAVLSSAEQTSLNAIRGETILPTRTPIPFESAQFSVGSDGEVTSVTGFPALEDPTTPLAQLITGTDIAEFGITGFEGAASIPVHNMAELLDQINSQNTAAWADRQNTMDTPASFARMQLRVRDDGDTTHAVPEIVVGDHWVTLNVTVNGEPTTISLTPGSVLTLNRSDRSLRYAVASMAANSQVTINEVDTGMREGLSDIRLLASGQHIEIASTEQSLFLGETTTDESPRLNSIVIGDNPQFGSLNFRQVDVQVDPGIDFRSTPERTNTNAVAPYTPMAADGRSGHQFVSAAGLHAEDYYALLRRYPTLAPDANGMMRVTNPRLGETDPDYSYQLALDLSTRTYGFIRTATTEIVESNIAENPIPTPVAVAMAPEFAPASAMAEAYATERRFGGSEIYRMAFDTRDIFEPVLDDERVTNLMTPMSNAEWLSRPRDVLYTENGQDVMAPLRHWGYIRHGRNVTVIVPAVVAGVVRRPDAGRGGSGDRVLVFKVPTENGTIAVAQPLDHQRYTQPGSRSGVDDFIFSPDAEVMERLLQTTPDTAIDFMELARAGYFRSNPQTDGILGGEDEVAFWNQQAQSGRVTLISFHYRGRDAQRIFDNLPPEEPDTENHGAFDIGGYIHIGPRR